MVAIRNPHLTFQAIINLSQMGTFLTNVTKHSYMFYLHLKNEHIFVSNYNLVEESQNTVHEYNGLNYNANAFQLL